MESHISKEVVARGWEAAHRASGESDVPMFYVQEESGSPAGTPHRTPVVSRPGA